MTDCDNHCHNCGKRLQVATSCLTMIKHGGGNAGIFGSSEQWANDISEYILAVKKALPEFHDLEVTSVCYNPGTIEMTFKDKPHNLIIYWPTKAPKKATTLSLADFDEFNFLNEVNKEVAKAMDKLIPNLPGTHFITSTPSGKNMPEALRDMQEDNEGGEDV